MLQTQTVALRLALCLLLLVTAKSSRSGTGLFLDDQPLEIDLFLDVKGLCREEGRSSCPDVSATLSYSLDGQQHQDIPVLVKTRGSWRSKRDICSVPPLFLAFPEALTKTTLFAGQDLLPLTTHCNSKHTGYDEYVLKEYLAYRIYELFTDKSVRVRLVHVRYTNPTAKKLPDRHYGFLNEHFFSVAARNGAELWKPRHFDLSQSDPMEMATMELFQYMIGNTDFSALAQHNIVLLRDPEGRVTPLPFDFDFSGLVWAEYAGPPENLPLHSVRQRFYRGFCHQGLDWDALFEIFRVQRLPVYELIESVPGLSQQVRKSTHNYLKEFYEILDSPKKRQKKIVTVCRVR
jgi:hypothetical protein